MIVTSSPLRIPLGGDGTDVPSYYRDHTGFVISAAINKYVYITLHETFGEKILLKYSKLEEVQRIEEIKHPIIREALNLVGIDEHPHLEIMSMSDIPPGAELGPSGSFTTALLRALHCLKKNAVSARELAEQACHIELDILKEPIGKQDQYIASFGGITCFPFHPDGRVDVEPLRMAPQTVSNLEDNLILFFTGSPRGASAVVSDESKSKLEDSSMVDNLHFIKQLGYDTKAALESGDLRRFAELMHMQWEHEQPRPKSSIHHLSNECYELARANGALGGKLIGSGGGGFLIFYTEEKTRLRHAMINAGMREVRFKFDFGGSQVILQS